MNPPRVIWSSLKFLKLRTLLLLSRFSRVWLCATPWMAAHQAPPSLGFSREEHWSGLPFLSPMHEREKWKWSHSVVFDSWRPHGLQGSSVHGIFQARVLEWVAIAFSLNYGRHILIFILHHLCLLDDQCKQSRAKRGSSGILEGSHVMTSKTQFS